MKYRKSMEQIKALNPPPSLEILKQELGITRIINLALNECSSGFSPRVAEAVSAAIPQLFRYPDAFCTALRQKLAAKCGIEPDQLIFGDGIFEILSFISQVFVDSGDEVVIPEPSFGWYKVSTWSANGTIISVPLVNNAIDLPAVARAVTPRTKLIWLCNPHNPMGTIFRSAEFQTFLAQVPDDVAIILDEAYFEYADSPDFPDSIALLGKHPNLIILRTFSKVYGLAGLRVGYGIARAETINYLNKVRTPPNVNHFAQVAAIAALEDTAFTAEVIASNARRVKDYYRVCRELGLEYIPTHANFIMIDVGIDGDLAAREFLRHGIILRSGSEIAKPSWVRITIGTDEENQQVFAILKSLVESSRLESVQKTSSNSGCGSDRKPLPTESVR